MFLREIAASQHNLPPPTAGLSLWIGSSLIVVGILTILQSAMSHLRFVHRLARGEPYVPPRISPGVVVAFLLAALGIAMAAHMVAAAR